MKALPVAMVSLFALLVAANNLLDYDSNFAFVQHVLSMDTTFDGNSLMWRAITAPWVHHLAYLLIIVAEFIVALLCGLGAWRMLRGSHDLARYWEGAMIASWGLIAGIGLWFGGFMTVGAEWFLMWQSPTWNGQEAAFRFIMCLFACLIFIHLPERASPTDDE
ncbi:MAG: DUF2165 domain-containing protein [Pseudomonadota bacterium]